MVLHNYSKSVVFESPQAAKFHSLKMIQFIRLENICALEELLLFSNFLEYALYSLENLKFWEPKVQRPK